MKPIKLTAPKNWAEMKEKQQKKAIAILFAIGMDNTQKKIKLLCLLIGKTKRWLRKYANEVQVADMMIAHTKFIMNLELDINPVGYLKKGWFGEKYLSPGHNFDRLTLQEFAQADEAAKEFLETHEAKPLNELCAILYRKEGEAQPNGDTREPFNEWEVEARMEQMAQMDTKQKLTIFWWWNKRKQEIIQSLPEVFKQGGNNEKSSASWLDFILETAGGKFGSLQQTENTQAITVLYDLNRQMKVMKELKRKQKKNG